MAKFVESIWLMPGKPRWDLSLRTKCVYIWELHCSINLSSINLLLYVNQWKNYRTLCDHLKECVGAMSVVLVIQMHMFYSSMWKSICKVYNMIQFLYKVNPMYVLKCFWDEEKTCGKTYLLDHVFVAIWYFPILLFFNFFKLCLLWERQRQWKWGRSRERGRMQAPHCHSWARCGARTHKPWDHDLSRNQEFDT